MTQIDEEIIQKREITRLKNLLSAYRGHIITKMATVMKRIDIVQVIERVDNAINLIKSNL